MHRTLKSSQPSITYLPQPISVQARDRERQTEGERRRETETETETEREAERQTGRVTDKTQRGARYYWAEQLLVDRHH
eukprot:COSAG03_NODE_13337_length_506_cov_4.714988_1_plen_78_part_00